MVFVKKEKEVKPKIPTLSEYCWEYTKSHNYCSRSIIAGNYIEKFLNIRRRDERKPVQKKLSRQVSQLFTIMKHLGICNRFSINTIAINREIFNNFTLQDVLKYNWHDVHKKVKLEA